MSESSRDAAILPLPLPGDRTARKAIVMLRRMAIHGLRDAHACAIALDIYGAGFRRLLALTRCLLHEIATASRRSIHVAPCCAPRMTRDEALLLDAMFEGCPAALLKLTGSSEGMRALDVASALALELAALGRERAR